ncbi:hypothetical protein KP509_10G037800 [Ceratopteris richardii]|uniref:Uncharacterized protein n=1 Tax=Ceratopteris richardii TaxID=49495 RepID=A0A8T2U3W8_CERRI|nr:hypothetical protein KP509_10G037800 [Ceratopteris richardii]
MHPPVTTEAEVQSSFLLNPLTTSDNGQSGLRPLIPCPTSIESIAIKPVCKGSYTERLEINIRWIRIIMTRISFLPSVPLINQTRRSITTFLQIRSIPFTCVGHVPRRYTFLSVHVLRSNSTITSALFYV